MNETSDPVTGPEAKAKATAGKRPRRPRGELPPGTQHFLDVMASVRLAGPKLKKKIASWLKKRGVKWRTFSEWSSGKTRDFSHPNLLAQFAREVTGKPHNPQRFTNPSGIRNFAAEFPKNFGSSFLKEVCGTYKCVRPGTKVLAAMELYEPETSAVHELNLMYYGDSLPGTFTYTTTKKNTDVVGSWHGYVVTKSPYIFLSGFCVDGEDASYFVLRPYPDKAFSENMLVGIQSLLLAHPPGQPGAPKHAVSRLVVALREDPAPSEETLEAAHRWIRENQEKSGGLLVNLGDQMSAKI